MAVPYWKDRTGGSSHPYIDLRRQPGRIDELPELRRWPALRDAVRRLNSDQSAFRTLGCEHRTERRGDSFLLRAYVQLAFAERDRCFEEVEYYELFHRLAMRSRVDERAGLRHAGSAAEFLLVRTHFGIGVVPEDEHPDAPMRSNPGWSVDFNIACVGDTAGAAQGSAESALRFLVDLALEHSAHPRTPWEFPDQFA
jgi:hypothetical protein